MTLTSIMPTDALGGDVLARRLAQVEIVAVDLDGTLLNASAEVDETTVRAIRHATDAGIRVIPTTGRVRSVLPERLFEIGRIEHAVCCAGATVLSMGETRESCRALKDDGFAPAEAAEIIEMLLDRYRGDVLVDFACEGIMYSEPDMLAAIDSFDTPGLSVAYVRRSRRPVDDLVAAARRAPAPIGRVNIFARNEDLRREIMATLSTAFEFELGNSLGHNVEINPAGTSKWRGLTWLCGHLGVSANRIMAVGDGSNDVDMLRHAWVGVAMQNSSSDALAAADARTVWPNDESGVARLLDEVVELRCRLR